MLDIDPSTVAHGSILPRGWHFPLMPAIIRRSDLRTDGFPGLGVVMPDLGLPRLMLGGRTVSYHQDLIVGDIVERRSTLLDIVRKGDGERALAVVTVGHDLIRAGETSPAVSEEQRYVMLAGTRRFQSVERLATPVLAEHVDTLVPDATMLFQYSALAFNSHKIHLDRAYAREVEGFPDLVVNGGLTTLLLTEFARLKLGLSLKSLTMTNKVPLFCDRVMTFAASRSGDVWEMRAHDDLGQVAATAEVIAS
ncbi:hypothetical protein Q4F19_12840 [Sphingomonas sp. BIUV-7]|uniref:3-methylfumaryl-CoA hydratase n=1 Tax=Sphingomonas natans TaxID=3063330 RepID=A0ABT8YB99_9SPHN|nr:hypothetical protein [Sphingomonas sp. BIUV-7]MDO6415272.1 hypothetical protein [Sphingomonas sp. BIUV-7]